MSDDIKFIIDPISNSALFLTDKDELVTINEGKIISIEPNIYGDKLPYVFLKQPPAESARGGEGEK